MSIYDAVVKVQGLKHPRFVSFVNVSYNDLMFFRLNAEIEAKGTHNPPPLVTGSLSPIMDMDEDIRDVSGKKNVVSKKYKVFYSPVSLLQYYEGASVGAMPSLDDSDCQIMKQGESRQPTSPFIERKSEVFADHVMSVLGQKKEIRFNELLPGGSTRKTAGVAFHHILSEHMYTLLNHVSHSLAYKMGGDALINLSKH